MRRVTEGDGSEHESHDLLTWSCFVCYTFSEVVNVNMSACEVPLLQKPRPLYEVIEEV